MVHDSLSALSLWLVGFRLAYVAAGLAGAALLWRRPRPAAAVGLVLGLQLAAWVAYVAPLDRLYALDERNDRAFAVATAATVAAGNSAWEHAQVDFASIEPFWDVVAAALALFKPEWVVSVFGWLSPLSLIVVALGLYLGLRERSDDGDAWELVLVVLAVLGLSSLSMSGENPLPPFWSGNFLLKPNHASALGVAGLVLGLRARRARWWVLGLALGLLAWTFPVAWAFVALALGIGSLLRPRGHRDWRGLGRALALSLLLVSPDLLNLARDYSPLGSGTTPEHHWSKSYQLARVLAVPHWVTTDLGPLLVLGVLGALVLRIRRRARDALLLGLLASGAVCWIGSAAAAAAGFAFQPDELHYFMRFGVSACAGAALAAAARHVESWKGLALGQGHLLVFCGCLPFTFPAYWNPVSMDRYYPKSLTPIGASELAYGSWVAQNTPGDAVFLAGPSSASWIAVLAGRRVLLTGDTRPPADYDRRKQAEEALLTSPDPDVVRRVASRLGVDYLAIDMAFYVEYGGKRLPRLGASEIYERVYRNAAVEIWKIHSTPPTQQPDP